LANGLASLNTANARDAEAPLHPDLLAWLLGKQPELHARQRKAKTLFSVRTYDPDEAPPPDIPQAQPHAPSTQIDARVSRKDPRTDESKGDLFVELSEALDIEAVARSAISDVGHVAEELRAPDTRIHVMELSDEERDLVESAARLADIDSEFEPTDPSNPPSLQSASDARAASGDAIPAGTIRMVLDEGGQTQLSPAPAGLVDPEHGDGEGEGEGDQDDPENAWREASGGFSDDGPTVQQVSSYEKDAKTLVNFRPDELEKGRRRRRDPGVLVARDELADAGGQSQLPHPAATMVMDQPLFKDEESELDVEVAESLMDEPAATLVSQAPPMDEIPDPSDMDADASGTGWLDDPDEGADADAEASGEIPAEPPSEAFGDSGEHSGVFRDADSEPATQIRKMDNGDLDDPLSLWTDAKVALALNVPAEKTAAHDALDFLPDAAVEDERSLFDEPDLPIQPPAPEPPPRIRSIDEVSGASPAAAGPGAKLPTERVRPMPKVKRAQFGPQRARRAIQLDGEPVPDEDMSGESSSVNTEEVPAVGKSAFDPAATEILTIQAQEKSDATGELADEFDDEFQDDYEDGPDDVAVDEEENDELSSEEEEEYSEEESAEESDAPGSESSEDFEGQESQGEKAAIAGGGAAAELFDDDDDYDDDEFEDDETPPPPASQRRAPRPVAPPQEEASLPSDVVFEEESLGALVVDAPSRAMVFVDGEEKGRGRVVLKDVDRFAFYAVRIHCQGYAPWTAKVSLRGQKAAKVKPDLVGR
jgi:hypothetical protein